jgi:hypothetical protein
VPPPVQGVDGHAEHLRQLTDCHQSIKLLRHFSPPVPAGGDWSGKPPVIASICERLESIRWIAHARRSSDRARRSPDRWLAPRLPRKPDLRDGPLLDCPGSVARMRTNSAGKTSEPALARIDGRASRRAWGYAGGLAAKFLRPSRVPDAGAREMLAD